MTSEPTLRKFHVQLAYDRDAWKTRDGGENFRQQAWFLEAFQRNTGCTDEELIEWSKHWKLDCNFG